jgi:hypothetical protein
VIVTFCGATLQGFADGTFVAIERSSDSFTKHVGADGEVARTQSADKSGTVTVTLLQTSASNDVLSALAVADERTGLGTGPLSVVDASGRTVALCAEAWIKKPASIGFSKEAEGREWVFECGHLEEFVGGN